MSPKGHILDSNGPKSLKLCVTMGKLLISVKNSKNSLICANFGCFGMFRVKKMMYLLSKKVDKAHFQRPIPMVYSKNDFKFWVRTTRRLVTIEQKIEIWYAKLRCAHFSHIQIFERVSAYDFRKSGELWQLGGNVFLKSFRLYFKAP